LPPLTSAKPASPLLRVAVVLAVWNGRWLLPRVPPILLGMAVGLLSYYGLSWLGLAGSLGPVIGAVAGDVAQHPLLQSFSAPELVRDVAAAGTSILTGAIALTVVASIDALLFRRLVTPPPPPPPDAHPLPRP